MEIVHICLKSRYPLNPNSLSRLSSLFILSSRRALSYSTESPRTSFGLAPTIHSTPRYSPIEHNSVLIAHRFIFDRNYIRFRLFSTCLTDLLSADAATSSREGDMVELNDLDAPNFLIESIVDIVRRDGVDMEFWLYSIGTDLSKRDLIETLRTLNRLGLNALRLFNWIQNANRHISSDPVVCSLLVDNCGRLGYYQTMLALLKDFSEKRVLLTDEAFAFLGSLCSTKEVFRRSLERLVKILKEADGTCCYSGISTLIKMCCTMNYFDMARFVVDMNKTEAMFYRVWLRESCLQGRFQEALAMIPEMRRSSCDVDARTYNYLISCLWKYGMIDLACKVLEEMVENGCPVNAITFEVVICHFCKVNELEKAVKSYQIMVSHGIEPRCSTCSAIIKAYFSSKRYEEAYNYLIHVCENQKCLTNALYSLLANLHRKRGDLAVAYRLLMEMIEKGLKPDFVVYVNVSKKLYNSGRKDLAGILKSRFSSLVGQASKK